MKMKDVLLLLSEMNPEEEVLAIIITKDEFDYNEDDEVTLTKEAWAKVVREYETSYEYNNLYESIGVTVAEHAEVKEDLQ